MTYPETTTELYGKTALLAKKIAQNQRIDVLSPRGVERKVDPHRILKDSEITKVKYTYGKLKVYLDHPNITIEKTKRTADLFQPPDHLNVEFEVRPMITWDMESIDSVIAEIEIEEK